MPEAHYIVFGNEDIWRVSQKTFDEFKGILEFLGEIWQSAMAASDESARYWATR